MSNSNPDVIGDVLQKIMEQDGSSEGELECPFCGAGESFIETYDLDDTEVIGNDIEGEIDQEDENEVISADAEIGEVHCIKCGKWWVYDDKSGEEYEIEYDEEAHRAEQNITGRPVVPIDSFKKFYSPGYDKGIVYGHTPSGIPDGSNISNLAYKNASALESEEELSELKGPRVRRRARRRSKPRARLGNIKRGRLQKRKSAQRKRLSKRIGGSRTKKVVWRKGKFVVVKKDFRGRVKESTAGLRLYYVKRLDEQFDLNGRLIRLSEKCYNTSNFEAICSRILKKNENISFDDFVEKLSEKFLDEAKYIRIFKDRIASKITESDEETEKNKKVIDEDLDYLEDIVKEFTKALKNSKTFKGMNKKQQEKIVIAATMAV